MPIKRTAALGPLSAGVCRAFMRATCEPRAYGHGNEMKTEKAKAPHQPLGQHGAFAKRGVSDAASLRHGPQHALSKPSAAKFLASFFALPACKAAMAASIALISAAGPAFAGSFEDRVG